MAAVSQGYPLWSSPLAYPRRFSMACSCPKDTARDDQALDLLRALVDLRDLGVAQVPFGGIFRDVAVAAEELQRVGRDPDGCVAGQELGHAGLARAGDAPLAQLRRLQREQARRFDLRGHVRHHELDALEVCYALAELLALLDVGHGVVE